MNTRQPTLMEVLRPNRFPGHPKRTEATRTIVQPDLDRYELAEAIAANDCHGGGTSSPTATSARAL